ncbi:nucleoside hydrolase [Erysipelothrix sp. HDW6C]|uniref:nucleoside hydrolase n=1 Tax=Erysipelothrix sp. HDW6C TaxID=2714930 RepID=UPI001409BB4B|nr:nucleoside hydrolase [Erysipelothrix sp. HDW6C]QIK69548.1 nucleoside hydrolase [Erysipelothrix sp. HDW6C]
MKKIILDVDTGIDDCLAIAYLLAQPNVDIVGITAVYGNVDVNSAALNCANLLHLLGRNAIPVYCGAEHAMHESSFVQLRGGKVFHGDNGIGDVHFDENQSVSTSENAIDFIVSQAQNVKNLTLIATGPLTNIAQAITLNQQAMQNVERIILMGGALCVPGNVSPFAEANISHDAEAAKVVFESGIPITMIGLDVTSRAIITRSDLEHWKTLSNKSETLLNIQDHYFKAHELVYPQWHGAAMHDALAAIVALEPTLVKTVKLPVTVLTSEQQYGRTILDLSRISDITTHTVDVAIDMNPQAFKELLIKSIDTVVS